MTEITLGVPASDRWIVNFASPTTFQIFAKPIYIEESHSVPETEKCVYSSYVSLESITSQFDVVCCLYEDEPMSP